ncbi:MAG: glycosyltransferase family 39 protein [Candidatus Riflebacteria bacterium]|nr:glycosyltransferase family 39 protein [Candidatus Riflebacteria bacterium]
MLEKFAKLLNAGKAKITPLTEKIGKFLNSGRAKIIFIVLSILSTGFFGVYLLTKPQMTTCFQKTAFYAIFIAFFTWLAVFPYSIPRTWNTLVDFFRRRGFPIGLALVLTIAAFLTSPVRFRILADETNLMGMAQAMYDFHEFYNPTQVLYYYEGITNVISSEYDKRPVVFPFLVYLAHSFFGYNDNNGFVVNAISSFLLLLFFYVFLERFFSRLLATAGVILLAAFPLVVLWMTSCGFEIPNLLFAVLAFIALERFLEHKTARDAEFLVLTLLILSQVRYESVLFAIVILPLVPLFLPSSEYPQLSWRTIIIPPFFLPIVWQRLTTWGQALFQMEGDKPPFSTIWLIPNLKSAWAFFTGAKTAYGMIPVVFDAAISGFLLALVLLILRRKEISLKNLTLFGTAFTLIFLNCAVLFLYYWGNLTLQYAIRLGLLYVPFLVFSVIYFLNFLTDNGTKFRRSIILVAVALLFYSWPRAGINSSVREILLFREFAAAQRFLRANYPGKEILLISDRSNLYTPFRYSGVNFGYVNANPDGIMINLKYKLFQDVLALQRINYKDDKPCPETFLMDAFKTETLFETQLSEEQKLRIARVKPAK